jgi:hypothetical protein
VLSIGDGGKPQIHRFSLPENAVVPPSFADWPHLLSKNLSPQSSMASPLPIFYNTALSSIFPTSAMVEYLVFDAFYLGKLRMCSDSLRNGVLIA